MTILLQVQDQYGHHRLIGKLLALVLSLQFVLSPVQADPVTIAALGDSLTQGYGLPAEDGLVPQLQRHLTGRGAEVTIINAGVSGDTTAGGLARVNWTLTPDIDALIVALGGNDLLRGIPPGSSRANLDGILKTASDKGLPILLVGMQAPANYGADYQVEFDAIYPDLAETYGTLLFPGYIAALTQGRDWPEVLQSLMQADAIHPNAEGVAVIVKELGPTVEALIDRARKKNE